jgi:hypothetical protein
MPSNFFSEAFNATLDFELNLAAEITEALKLFTKRCAVGKERIQGSFKDM